MWNPRVGGEKILEPSMGVGNFGSPPRGRGKGFRRIPVVGFEGITPAQVGKSLFCFTAAVPIQDHPRIGGEKG